jgi:hypothetical protein
MGENISGAPSPLHLAVGLDVPRRVQLRRTKGWRMPPNTVKVCRSTVFGNPYTIEENGRWDAVALYRFYVTDPLWEDPHVRSHQERLRALIPSLRGKNLACFCPLDKPCHADVLLELANATGRTDERQAPAHGTARHPYNSNSQGE